VNLPSPFCPWHKKSCDLCCQPYQNPSRAHKSRL